MCFSFSFYTLNLVIKSINLVKSKLQTYHQSINLVINLVKLKLQTYHQTNKIYQSIHKFSNQIYQSVSETVNLAFKAADMELKTFPCFGIAN